MSDEFDKIMEVIRKERIDTDLKISELEKNCEVSFVKIEDHIMRILKVIDVQAQSTDMLQIQINELREEINANTELTREFNRKRKRELNELKEKFDEREKHQFQDYFKLQRFEEVLRELILNYKKRHSTARKEMDELLEKLDSKSPSDGVGSASARESLDRQTEKKEYIKKDIKDFKSDEPIVFVNPKFEVPKHLKDSEEMEKKEVTSGFIKEGYYVSVFREIKPIPPFEDSGGDGYQGISYDGKDNEPKIKFTCGGCKKEFESYHDGIGYNTGFCPKCLDIHETIGLKDRPPGGTGKEPRENDKEKWTHIRTCGKCGGRIEIKCNNPIRHRLISEFQHDWEGLKYLCRDDDEAWEYWLKIYKKWEKIK